MAKPIKLLMITHNYPRFDGDYAGIFVSLLASKLSNYGIEPVVLAPHAKGLKEYEVLNNVKVYRFRYAPDENEIIAYQGNMHKLVLGSVTGIFQFKRFLNAFRKSAYEVIEKEKIDVLAGHWLVPAGLVMKPIHRKLKLPMIMSSHGTDIRLMRNYFRALYKYLKPFCIRLKSWTVVSSFLKNGILDVDKNLSSVLEVLPMPHDEQIFYIDDSIVRNKNLVVAVTRFTEQKRYKVLLSAFALASAKNNNLHLEIYATGGDRQIAEAMIEKLGVSSSVSIKSPVPQTELRKIYNRAGMVVLNSYAEGFGLALSEAMLCGAAVIGTNSGGIIDIIKHERTGLLVELDNPEKLADAMIELSTDDAKREQLARAGNKFAQETYQSEPLAKRYAELIKNAML